MKSKIHLITFLIAFLTLNINAQITTTIDEVYVNGQTSVTNCNTIDFGTTENNTLTFYFTLTKASSVEDGYLKIKLKYDSNSNGSERGSLYITQGMWNQDEFVHTIATNIDESEVQENGSSIYLEFTEVSEPFEYYNSCEHPIIKTPVPSFSLSPTSTTVSCGSTSARVFTVTPSNIPSGSNVVYNWSVGNGWGNTSGNPVSNFTTTTTSVTLVPNAFPPSNINVTPVLDGDSYPTLTSTVSLGNFNPIFEISGASFVCDSGIYAFNNLPNSISIQSVSTSNSNIATASLDANGDITVTKVSDGIITLSAVLQNACNQTVTKTKNIQIGIPTSAFNATVTGSDDVCQGQNYTYTLSGANHPCVNDVDWTVSDNLNIISQTATSVTVTTNPFNNLYAGVVTASISGSTTQVSKGVWVGVPSNVGLVIQKIGAFDLFANRWSKLRAFYSPLIYEAHINNPLDVTFEWQIPFSMVRNYANTAYKDVRPRFGGQLNIGVRAVCECGNGEWKYRLFDVGGGNGVNELIPDIRQ